MIAFWIWKIAQVLVLALPKRVSYALAVGIADLHFLFSRKSARAVRDNLKHVMVSASGREVSDRMVREVFRNFGRYLVDFFSFFQLMKEQVTNEIDIVGLESLDRAFSRGRGVVLVTAHIGNWELAGVMLSLLGYPMNVVALSHDNTRINRWFVRHRGLKGIKDIPVSRGVVRQCLRALKSGEVVGLAADRDTTGNGIPMAFFGCPASIPRGPASLALRVGSPVVVCHLTRTDSGRYRFAFEKPLFVDTLRHAPDGVRALTKQITHCLESVIREKPEQWSVFYPIWEECATRGCGSKREKTAGEI